MTPLPLPAKYSTREQETHLGSFHPLKFPFPRRRRSHIYLHRRCYCSCRRYLLLLLLLLLFLLPLPLLLLLRLGHLTCAARSNLQLARSRRHIILYHEIGSQNFFFSLWKKKQSHEWVLGRESRPKYLRITNRDPARQTNFTSLLARKRKGHLRTSHHIRSQLRLRLDRIHPPAPLSALPPSHRQWLPVSPTPQRPPVTRRDLKTRKAQAAPDIQKDRQTVIPQLGPEGQKDRGCC